MQYIKEMNKTKDEITCNTCKGKLICIDVDLVCINCGIVVAQSDSINVPVGVTPNPPTSISASPALKKGEKQIERISSVLGISKSVTEKGYEIFYKCEKQKMLTGRTATTFAAACLFVACRKAGLVWQIKDFINSGKIKEKIFVAYYKIIIQALEITPEIISPIQHISRIAYKAEPPLNGIIQKQAIDIINQLNENAGKHPVSIAAAALCYVAQLKNAKYTLRQIAIAAELSEGTVRNRIKDIKKQVIKKP